MSVPAHLMTAVANQATQPIVPQHADPSAGLLGPAPAPAAPLQTGVAPYNPGVIPPAAPAPGMDYPPAPAASTVPASHRPLPTHQEMMAPYNTTTDPNHPDAIAAANGQGAVDPRTQGERLAQARHQQVAEQARLRTQQLENENRQLLANQQQTVGQVQALQQQMNTLAAPPVAPPVDPSAQFALTQEQQDQLGDQLPAIEQMMNAARASALHEADQLRQQDIEALRNEFNQSLAPVTQAATATQDMIDKQWNDGFTAKVTNELGFNIMGMRGDPEWEHFVAQPLPMGGGVTFGQQLVHLIKGHSTDDAFALVKTFHDARQARYGAPAAQQHGAQPVMQPMGVRAPAPVGQPDAGMERQSLYDQYAALSDQLARQKISIPEFQTKVKPIDDRLAEINGTR